MEKIKENRRVIPVKWHMIGWLVLIAFYAVYRTKIGGEAFGGGIDFLIFVACQIGLFYTNAFGVLPKAFRDKEKYWWRIPLYLILLVFAVLFVLIALSIGFGDLEVGLDISKPWRLTIVNFFLIVLPFFTGLVVSSAFYGLRWGIFQYKAHLNAQQQNLLLINQVEVHRQNWRKAQLPPHLLNNLLTTLRYITIQMPEKAPHAMGIVIKMMRYYVDSSPQGYIPLCEEIDQVENLIQLNELRRERKPQLQLLIGEKLDTIQIIPMLVFLLAENTFHYGVLDDEEHPAMISVTEENGKLSIVAENWILSRKSASGTESGLANLKERLAYFYPGRHLFEYGEVNDLFRVKVVLWEE